MTTSIAVIDKLAYGGNGVCRIEGKVCFVPFSCPGDEVLLRISAQKKSYSTAEITEVLQSSLDRAIPPCPIFGSCGGCSWQHIQYPVQLDQKRQIFAETLWRGGRVDGNVIRDVVASPLEYSYRSRVQFKVSVKDGTLRIGFYRNGSHIVENAANGCLVARPVINEIMGCFRTILADFDDVGFIDQISVDAGEHGVVAIVNYAGKNLPGIRAFLLEHSTELGPCTGLFLQAGKNRELDKLWGSDEIRYSMPHSNPNRTSFSLSYLPGGFAQINQAQNTVLLSVIRQLGCFSSSDKLLDLYCGNGNFSIPIASDVASVLGIEGSGGSIRSARLNATCNGMQNIEFVCSDVHIALQQLVKADRLFDVVLIDPPRAGAGDVVPNIVRLNPNKIIYVSCDPSTLARDCGLFADHGYQVVESIPIDMFPQTYHLESVTLLIKE